MSRSAVLFFLFLTTGCNGQTPSVCELRGGYSYEDTDSYNHIIVKQPSTVAVLPHVSRCEPHGRYIIGERLKPEGLSDPRFFEDPLGWFVIDTSESLVAFGFSEVEARRFIDQNATNKPDVHWRNVGVRVIFSPH